MPTSDRFKGTKPPSPRKCTDFTILFTVDTVVARLRSTDLPEDTLDSQAAQQEPFLSGHPILPEDMGTSTSVARLIQ